MQPTILDLPQRVAAAPPAIQTLFDDLFAVSIATGQMDLPPEMLAWTERQFGSVEAVRQQTVVKIVNRLTLEGALLNPARANRPAMSRADDAAIDAWVAAELRHDVFADPPRTTPADTFGRIRGEHCVTASNIAKYDGWHAVVICDEPHPLHFSRVQVLDYVDVAWRWIEAAHARDPQAIYPLITWNCLPRSGASLAHGHLQVALGRDLPYTRVELWRRAASAYRARTNRTYLDDLHTVHASLGLEIPQHAGVRRFAHLTPSRNREVVLLGPSAERGAAAPVLAQLADALHETLRWLIECQGVRCFNASIALPPLADDGLDWRDIPPYVRLGDRGDPLAVRSDIGVMELYGMPVITADPFQIANHQC